METKALYLFGGVVLLLVAFLLLSNSEKIKKSKLWPLAVMLYILAIANGIGFVSYALENVPL